MEWLLYVVAVVFAILGLGCLGLVIIGLPGIWCMIGMAILVELVDSLWLSSHDTTFGWWIIGTAFALALVGEACEALMGVYGAKVGGGSRRCMIGAFIGGLVGAIALTPLIPVPVLGTVLGAIIGTFCGALLGEMTVSRAEDEGVTPIKPALGATVGRILGTGAKACVGFMIWAILVVQAFWPG